MRKEVYCPLCKVRLTDYDGHKPKAQCPSCKRIFRVEGKSEPYIVTIDGGFDEGYIEYDDEFIDKHRD